MTIRVTVKNEDSRESAVIGVTVQHINSAGVVCGGMSEVELKGGSEDSGESEQFNVHTGQQVLVRELRQ